MVLIVYIFLIFWVILINICLTCKVEIKPALYSNKNFKLIINVKHEKAQKQFLATNKPEENIKVYNSIF